jgi:hypothetical protein
MKEKRTMQTINSTLNLSINEWSGSRLAGVCLLWSPGQRTGFLSYCSLSRVQYSHYLIRGGKLFGWFSIGCRITWVVFHTLQDQGTLYLYQRKLCRVQYRVRSRHCLCTKVYRQGQIESNISVPDTRGNCTLYSAGSGGGIVPEPEGPIQGQIERFLSVSETRESCTEYSTVQGQIESVVAVPETRGSCPVYSTGLGPVKSIFESSQEEIQYRAR